MKDMPLAEAIREVLPIGPDVISVFHSRIASVSRAVQVALEEWPGTVMAYPDAGRQSPGIAKWHNRSLTNEESIDDFTNAAKTWVNQGVQIIGACCEFGVEYIEPLRKSIPSKISHTRSVTQ